MVTDGGATHGAHADGVAAKRGGAARHSPLAPFLGGEG